MKRLRLLGVALMAIFALTAAAASVAGAASLTVLPTPSAASPIKYTFKSIGATLLETVLPTSSKIECASVTGNGEITGKEGLGPVTFKFTGCKVGIISCTGLENATAGEISFLAESHLRHLLEGTTSKPSEGVALVILLKHVHFSCLGVLILVLGCVASMDLLTKEAGASIVELLVSSAFANFLQVEGVQKPLTIAKNLSITEDENCLLKTKKEAGAEEQSGQQGSGTIEKFEQNSKAVTLLVHLSTT